MKKRYISIYILMAIVFIAIGIYYRTEDQIYDIICASICYCLFYVPLYLYMVSRCVEESFLSMLVLREGSKTKNAIKYIKKILIRTVIFSSYFVICLALVEQLQNRVVVIREMDFYLAIFFIQIAGWSLIGMSYYFVYTITKNNSASVLLVWIVCIIMGMSSSVLFRIGKSIYNVFDTMIILERTGHYMNNIIHSGINILISVILGVVIIICQKRMDIMERRR